jgi:acetate kinase
VVVNTPHAAFPVVLQEAGDARARLALDMFVYRVRKYIGAYSAALSGRVDALIFSAGIGENSSIIRGMICEDFKVCCGCCGRLFNPSHSSAAIVPGQHTILVAL